MLIAKSEFINRMNWSPNYRGFCGVCMRINFKTFVLGNTTIDQTSL